MYARRHGGRLIKLPPRHLHLPALPILFTKVPRIEVRVVGTRALTTSASTKIATLPRSGRERHQTQRPPSSSTQKPSLHLSALWNGDHAASVKLSTCEGDSLEMHESPVSAATLRRGGGDSVGGGGLGLSNSGALRRVPVTSRLVVLPLYVPWIMKGGAKDIYSRRNCANRRCRGVEYGRHCSGGGGGLGCGCRGGSGNGFGRDYGHPTDEGGRSHCFQVRVDIAPRASIPDQTFPRTFGNGCRGNNEGTVALPSSSPTAPRRLTEVCFFERDLLRSEWTEILVPVCTDDVERDMRPREHQHGRPEAPPPDVAVVLHVRSAGFTPKDPPLWLLRRDFAERAVQRIMSASAAALVQPRVELSVLGLSGAVDSLLSESANKEKERAEDVLTQTGGVLAAHQARRKRQRRWL